MLRTAFVPPLRTTSHSESLLHLAVANLLVPDARLAYFLTGFLLVAFSVFSLGFLAGFLLGFLAGFLDVTHGDDERLESVFSLGFLAGFLLAILTVFLLGFLVGFLLGFLAGFFDLTHGDDERLESVFISLLASATVFVHAVAVLTSFASFRIGFGLTGCSQS